jgi:ribosome-binding protein aMBF1 (putative translation factor)
MMEPVRKNSSSPVACEMCGMDITAWPSTYYVDGMYLCQPCWHDRTCGPSVESLQAQLATAQQQLATMREALEKWQNARNEMKRHFCLATVAKYEAAERDLEALALTQGGAE